MAGTISCDIRLNSQLTPDQRELFQDSDEIRKILADAKTIAIVGLSTEKTKPSNMVASYLLDEGFQVIPVNPRADEILGQKCYPDLKSIPVPIDVVDVFRPASELPAIVAEAIEVGARAIWMQLRIVNIEAATVAKTAGLKVIVDKCMKMEHGRFGGALHWAGMNTEIISAQRRRLGASSR